MIGPNSDQLAYFLTRGRFSDDEYEKKEPSSEVVNRFRSEHLDECRHLSNPEIIRRYFS